MSVNDVGLQSLERIRVEGGDVLHAIKATDQGFSVFGEAYFSIIESGSVKAWKKHKAMTSNLIVPHGSVEFVFFDDFGTFRKEIVGVDNYVRLIVPPGLWFGFRGVSKVQSLILNISNLPHCPEEVEKKPINEIMYSWENFE